MRILMTCLSGDTVIRIMQDFNSKIVFQVNFKQFTITGEFYWQESFQQICSTIKVTEDFLFKKECFCSSVQKIETH